MCIICLAIGRLCKIQEIGMDVVKSNRDNSTETIDSRSPHSSWRMNVRRLDEHA